MKTFTIVQPTQRLLPHDLALLLAPVRVEEPSNPDAYAGRAEGVILDGGGHVLAFIVRLSHERPSLRARTLVPAADVTVMPGPVLRLSWTEERLRASPHLDVDRVPTEPVPDSQRVPASRGQAPPSPGAEAAKEGLEGAAIGAALGAVAGMALGGPIAAASLAVFFAVGGILGGVIAGAAREPAVGANDTKPAETDDRTPSRAWLGALEQRLQDPGLEAGGFVTTLRLFASTYASGPPRTPYEEPLSSKRSA